MNESNGLRLIEKLKKDPDKFRKEGGGYQLLEEYFMGFQQKLYMICYVGKINI